FIRSPTPLALGNIIFHVMFETPFAIDVALRNKIIQTVLIILALIIINKLATRFIPHGSVEEIRKKFHLKKAVEYTLTLIGVLLIGNLWISNFQSIITFLGLLSAGIAIALKDLFMNIAGWAFIYIRKPFDVGDRIQI